MKVLLIDDHPLILTALRSVIAALGDDVTVVGAGGAREARATLKRDPDFDLVLLDLALGDASGFDLLAELRVGWPALPVVVVSASDRAADVIRAIDLGAMGFVPKRANPEQLNEALRLVMSGGIYVPQLSLGAAPVRDSAYDDTVPAVMHRSAEHAEAHAGGIAALGLTPRQTEVLALLLQGKPNKLIARELKVSIDTVKDHVAAVLRALGVTSRTQAVLAVAQMSADADGFTAWTPSQR